MKKLLFLTVLVSLSFSSNLFSAAAAQGAGLSSFASRSLFTAKSKLDFSSPVVKRHLLDAIKEQAESKPLYALTIKAGQNVTDDKSFPLVSNWDAIIENGKRHILDVKSIVKYDKYGIERWSVTFDTKPVKEVTSVKVQIKYRDFIHTYEQCVDCVITIVP